MLLVPDFAEAQFLVGIGLQTDVRESRDVPGIAPADVTAWTTVAGDGARIDRDGDFWLLGRVDDVMNVSGHRISTTEVESALVSHPSVAEAAVVGAKDDTTGQAIISFVTVKGGVDSTPELGEELLLLREQAHGCAVLGSPMYAGLREREPELVKQADRVHTRRSTANAGV